MQAPPYPPHQPYATIGLFRWALPADGPAESLIGSLTRLHPVPVRAIKVVKLGQKGSYIVSSSSSSSYRKRVYTKFGDKGETSLLYGGRVSKNSPHTEAYGITDEAVSALGLARSLSEDQRVKDIVRDLQRDLFTIAAELATDPDKYELFQQHFTPVTEAMVVDLENTIDSLEEEFQMPTVFVLPGGTPASSALDMSRTSIRTAERRVVALSEIGGLTNPLIINYLNRLGDLLFVLARYHDRELPIERATGDRS